MIMASSTGARSKGHNIEMPQAAPALDASPRDVREHEHDDDGDDDGSSIKTQAPTRLSRSPHPYHHRRIGPFSNSSEGLLNPRSQGHDADRVRVRSPAGSDRGDVAPDDADGRGRGRLRRRESSIFVSESGSGSEADDESSSFLKGLPAPPMVPRKGLRVPGQENGPSPLATPRLLSSGHRTLSAEFASGRGDRGGGLRQEESIADARRRAEWVRRRRRAEQLRRATEVALVASLGWLIVRDADVWLQARKVYRGITQVNLHRRFHHG